MENNNNKSLTVTVFCSYCGAKMIAMAELSGHERPCPKCQRMVLIQENKPEGVSVSSDVSTSEEQSVSKPSTNKLVISFDDVNSSPTTRPTSSNKIVISFDDVNSSPTTKLTSTISSSVSVTSSVKKLSPRQRRLNSDLEAVTKGLLKSRYIKVVRMEGSPPEVYYVEYNVRGIESACGEQIKYRDQHLLKVQLTSGYPREQPKCQLLTPIFHPNFEPAVICIGDHWTAQERLIDLIIRIGEMIAYQSYNIKSPLDGEAAMWADQHEHLLPISKTDLMPPE
jgi:ubiquitin-protein ligase/phage FluMu protein Com